MKRTPKASKQRRAEIKDYDTQDTSGMIDATKPLTLKQLGIELPRVPPTQVASEQRRSERASTVVASSWHS
jgi:hypothetical protein